MATDREIPTMTTKSLDNNCQIPNTDAPSTFLIPISLIRCSVTKEARANIPRQEITIASPEKTVDRVPMRCSAANFRAYSSSTKLYSKGEDGSNRLNTGAILAIAVAALNCG